jgi:hypothetical protein
MSIVHIGIDLAKNVFAVHGMDEANKPTLVCPSVARAKLLELIAGMPAVRSNHRRQANLRNLGLDNQKLAHQLRAGQWRQEREFIGLTFELTCGRQPRSGLANARWRGLEAPLKG